jgi:hypothetical protein
MLSIAVAIPICDVMTLFRRLLGVVAVVVMCGLAGIPRVCGLAGIPRISWCSVLVVVDREVIIISCGLLCVGLIRWKVVGLTSIALMMCSRLPGSRGRRNDLICAFISACPVPINCRVVLISISRCVVVAVGRIASEMSVRLLIESGII